MSDQFFKTQMGKQFYQGTMPALVNAVNELTDALNNSKQEVKEENLFEDVVSEYVVHIVVGNLFNNIDRQDLEKVENQKFDSVDDLRNTINKKVSVYPITEYMDLYNNHDDDSNNINPEDTWFGYVQIKKDMN